MFSVIFSSLENSSLIDNLVQLRQNLKKVAHSEPLSTYYQQNLKVFY